jgi:uncharacterized protein involved in exopolysaccharide biosynthesis
MPAESRPHLSVRIRTMPIEISREEPTLFEILEPVARRWKLVIASLLIAIGAAGVITFLMPKQYETTLLLQLAEVTDQQVEDSYELSRIINSDAFQQTVALRLGWNMPSRQLQKMIEAPPDVNRSSLVTVRIRGNTPEQAVKLANGVAAAVIERHQKIVDDKLKLYGVYESELINRQQQFQKEIEQLKQDIDQIGKSDVAAAMLLQTRLNDKEMQLLTLRKQLIDFQAAVMSKVHTHGTNIVAPPILPQKPVKPNLILNVMMAAIASAFLVISGILIWEQYRTGYRRA